MIRRIREVAYELELPTGSRIHNIFHVSCLKKALGQQVTATEELPPTDDEGKLVVQPEAIIDTQERQLWSGTVREYLVRWRNLPDENATWERRFCNIHHCSCLRASNVLTRRTVIFQISNN